jgi:hypothetical protein
MGAIPEDASTLLMAETLSNQNPALDGDASDDAELIASRWIGGLPVGDGPQRVSSLAHKLDKLVAAFGSVSDGTLKHG